MKKKECIRMLIIAIILILIAVVTTIMFSYDEMIKFSNSKGFLLATI